MASCIFYRYTLIVVVPCTTDLTVQEFPTQEKKLHRDWPSSGSQWRSTSSCCFVLLCFQAVLVSSAVGTAQYDPSKKKSGTKKNKRLQAGVFAKSAKPEFYPFRASTRSGVLSTTTQPCASKSTKPRLLIGNLKKNYASLRRTMQLNDTTMRCKNSTGSQHAIYPGGGGGGGGEKIHASSRSRRKLFLLVWPDFSCCILGGTGTQLFFPQEFSKGHIIMPLGSSAVAYPMGSGRRTPKTNKRKPLNHTDQIRLINLERAPGDEHQKTNENLSNHQKIQLINLACIIHTSKYYHKYDTLVFTRTRARFAHNYTRTDVQFAIELWPVHCYYYCLAPFLPLSGRPFSALGQQTTRSTRRTPCPP